MVQSHEDAHDRHRPDAATTPAHRDLRIGTGFDALYDSGPFQGGGLLVDVSYSGAFVANASTQPPIGARARVYVYLRPPVRFELEGEVVRHTGRGFAIRYGTRDPDTQRFVDDAAALVAIRR